MEVGIDVARFDVLLIGMRVKYLLLRIKRIHAHGERVWPLSIASREMQVERMLADILDEVRRIAHGQ